MGKLLKERKKTYSKGGENMLGDLLERIIIRNIAEEMCKKRCNTVDMIEMQYRQSWKLW
ncbi:MAG: hypothetical protein BWX97_00444 [Firmicutes bacterium ADurb.Bin146]|nr:MAG: hypothetical protein BWX97_00444 [Firmicutes bacterium ADurb.Bin146]